MSAVYLLSIIIYYLLSPFSAAWVKNKTRQLRNSKAKKMAASGSARKQIMKRTAWIVERLQFLAPFVGGRDTVYNLNVVRANINLF